MDGQQNKKRRSIWSVFLILVLIIFLCICGIVGIGGYTYFNDNNFRNFISTNTPTTSTENKNIENFSSSEEYSAESDLIKLVEQSQPAVVTVAVKASANRGTPTNLQNRRTVGSGTGFFISNEGLLITNEHVVCGARASDLLIVTSDEKTYTVTSVASDPSQDVAILKVDVKNEKISTLKFANPSSNLKVGQEVVAIGNPFGDNPGTVTRGIISGLNRNISAQGSCDGENQSKDYEGVLQTDAAINSGNSGGPLLNLKGEVVGVNSATLQGANNISYTVPFTSVIKVLDRYNKNNGKIVSPFIGVSYRIISPDIAQTNKLPVGALVSSVVEGSPAARAGIKAGDIITKVGDYEIKFSLATTLNLHFEPGQKTTVQIYRSANEDLSNGQTQTLDITIGQR